MIDTHVHLDFPVFDADRPMVLERSRQAGVRQWLVPGVKLVDFPRMLSMTGPGVYFAFGLHPWFLAEQGEEAMDGLAQWLDRYQPVAVGEIGLDYLLAPETFPHQKEMFARQLALAKERRLPVLLHVRKAHEEVLMMVKRAALPAGGIVHAFSGSLQQAHGYLDLGFKLGFGGVVTWPRANRVRQVAAALPTEALVLETDAPDMPPFGHQGERNEPAYLPLVVATLAHLRGSTPEDIMQTTGQNAGAVLTLPEVAR